MSSQAVAGAARQRRIGIDERAQLLLLGRLLVHQPVVEQREELLRRTLMVFSMVSR